MSIANRAELWYPCCGGIRGCDHQRDCSLYEPPLTMEELRALRRLLSAEAQ